MTRFARAKGSKASNERREEEATPWHVMRQQLAEQLSNHGAQSEANTSYNLKAILNNRNNPQKEEVWSDFGETKSTFNHQSISNKERYNNEKHEFQKNKTKNNADVHAKPLLLGSPKLSIDSNKKESVEEITTEANKRGLLKKGKSKRKNLTHFDDKVVNKDSTETQVSLKGNGVMEQLERSSDGVLKRNIDNGDVEFEVKLNTKKRKLGGKTKEAASGKIEGIQKSKNKKVHGYNVFVETQIQQNDSSVKLLNCTKKSSPSSKISGSSVEPDTSLTVVKRTKNRNGPIGKSKNNIVELSKPHENPTSPLNVTSEEKTSPEKGKNGKVILAKQKSSNCSISKNESFNNSDSSGLQENYYKKGKFSYEKGGQTIIANGRVIHIIKYQGFYVKKDDADELKKLRKKLLAQNIPKEKLEHIMKLERRKAEKALAREKKKVCYHCRQFGHNFSDCPDIKESSMAKTGMCFKCGSLEHSHFECKVLQHQEFRHAVCFVCKEQGHIARQCPLNSQGLYPRGGSCHLCGEVTHLRKDCPKAVEEKTNNRVTVDVLKDDTVEDISGKSLQQKEIETKKKNVIMFK